MLRSDLARAELSGPDPPTDGFRVSSDARGDLGDREHV
jgi:hypothetical protein